MAYFEVFIPATEEAGFDLTLRIEADNWIAALKTGMSKVGLKGPGSNIFCDIKDDSIHVTDPLTKKVFRIQETTETSPVFDEQSANKTASKEPIETANQPVQPSTVSPPPSQGPGSLTGSTPIADPETSKIEHQDFVSNDSAQDDSFEKNLTQASTLIPEPKPAKLTASAETQIPETSPSPLKEVKVLEVARTPTETGIQKVAIGRTPSNADIEDILADLFMRSQDLFECPDLQSAFSLALDLITEKIPCESASVYRAEISTRDLFFATARGPKAEELLALNPRIPVGTGLAGFTVEEGVALAISDAHKDPRFFKQISEKIGYKCKSIITVPLQLEGQVMGAIQLINRKKGTSFDETDMSILNYLAHEIAEYLRRAGDVTI